jgi:LAS superfamily LD-carboxypeptidase LdcB
MALKYPSKRLVVPKELREIPNGKVPKKLMKTIKTGGLMWGPAADAFNRMYDAAEEAGIYLADVGDYRPYDRQEALFLDRYRDKPQPRKPEVTRTWNGKTWYLRKGCAPAGVPGTSNHGYGLAIDIAEKDKRGQIIRLTGKTQKWLCLNAPTFGFYLQGNDPKSPEFEIWHWQYCG